MKNIYLKIKSKANMLRHNNFDDFIFIHINKTGGSSIKKALNIPHEHLTALEKIAQVGLKNWNKKFTFAVVRNPWDKVVSHYHYRKQTNQTSLGDNAISFKQWVELTYGKQDSYYFDQPKMFMPQVNWISDESGNMLIDKVIHFENLNQEFEEVTKALKRKVILPYLKSSKHNHYSVYYDKSTEKIIAEWFRQDIKFFGYEFLQKI